MLAPVTGEGAVGEEGSVGAANLHIPVIAASGRVGQRKGAWTKRRQRGAGVNSQRATSTASAAPANSAQMKGSTLDGAIPAKLSVRLRAMVMVGLAKLVEAVNQYAAVM